MKGGGVGPTIAVYTCISLDITAGLTEASIERAVELFGGGIAYAISRLHDPEAVCHRHWLAEGW